MAKKQHISVICFVVVNIVITADDSNYGLLHHMLSLPMTMYSSLLFVWCEMPKIDCLETSLGMSSLTPSIAMVS